jgi:hypothetical protein
MIPFFTSKKTFFLIFLLSAYFSCFAQQAEIEAAKNYLKKYQEKYNFSDSDLNNMVVKDAYFSKTTGIYHIYFGQNYESVEVFNGICNVAIKDGHLVSIANSFVPSIYFTTPSPSAANQISGKTALINTIKYLNLPSANSASIQSTSNAKNINGISIKETFSAESISNEPVLANLVWFKDEKFDAVLNKTKLEVKLAWNINILTKDLKSGWSVHVDARTGGIISTYDNVIKCEFGHVHEHKERKNLSNQFVKSIEPNANLVNSNSYNIFDLGVESPSFGSRTIVESPYSRFAAIGTGPGATNGWHDDGTFTYTDTRGNNVHAQEDVNADNNGGNRPNPSNYIFDYTYTQGLGTASANQNAAITNLFYWNNVLHDVLWKMGFDEPAGNFQVNNLNRGGLGNDFVKADAQDGSGTDNANFFTPPDGANPRMQMYLWNYSPSYQGDSDFDNGVISHEYGHGWSIRLTGGPSNSSCLQNTEQGGEGWSDYLGLMLTTKWDVLTPTVASANVPRGIGTYLLGQAPTGAGIRPYRYSYDMATINGPVTYAKVGDFNFSQPHGIGSIWCTILWDMTWEIIMEDNAIEPNIYNTSNMVGNVAALKLVNEGLRLQPCSPSFVDARDAIFAADQAIFGGRYRCALSRAFARRGLGKNATTGTSSNDRVVTEDFTLLEGNTLSSPKNIEICSGRPLQYAATSNTPGTQFSWTRASVAGISNAAASDTNNLINEVLINTTNSPISVTYSFSLTPSGCGQSGSTFSNFTVLVNPSLNLPPVTNFNICQNATVPVNDGLKVNGVTTATNSVNVLLSTSSPKFARYFDSGNPNYYYNSFGFIAQSSGLVTFEITSGDYDTYLYLYDGNFNPLSPSLNYLTSDDDSGLGLLSLLSYPLVAGRFYTLVSTSYSPNELGPCTLVATQTGFQDIFQWYGQEIGGQPLYAGNTFNPVGVANSGIANTFVAQTKNYYVAKSSAPSCRNMGTFTIDAAAVDSIPLGLISSSDTICAQFNSGLLTLSGHTGIIRGWEISENDFESFQFVTSSSPTYVYSTLMNTKQIRVMMDKGGCNIARSNPATLHVITPVQVLSDTVERNPVLNKASLRIESDQVLANSANVHYDAGRSIELKEGFRTDSGTVFQASIFQNECSLPVVLTLQPGPSTSKDIDISSLFPTINYDTSKYLVPYSWTQFGVTENRRTLLEFDLSSIPANAVIDSAYLSLYYSSTFVTENPPFTGHFGTNSFEVLRVVDNWDINTNWTNQPQTTLSNKVTVSNALTSNQNYPKINVTNIVRDQFSLGNKGFMLKHVSESPYKITCLTSSNEVNASNRPRLVVYYRYF